MMLTRQCLNASQIEIMKKIDAFLLSNEKHISIVLGPGCGKTTMAMILAGELAATNNVIYLSYYKDLKENASKYFADNEIKARAETILHITNKVIHAGYNPMANDIWIIDDVHDLGPLDDLQKRLNSCASFVRTISFSDPTQSIGDMNEMMVWGGTRDLASTLVQVTTQAIDIRLSYAEEPDKGASIKNQFFDSLSGNTDLLRKSIIEHDRIQAEFQDVLDRQQSVIGMMAENETLKKEKLEYDKKLADAEKQIKALTQLCQIQSAMLTFFGISEDDVANAVSQIDEIRLSLQDRFLSPDDEIVEKAYQDFQNKVVEISIEIAKKSMKKNIVSDYTESLIKIFTPTIWNRLTEKSKSFLVTASYTYDNMSQQESKEQLDYSGICLLVTKAVEVETYQRFFDEYKSYLLRSVGTNVNNWPEAMTTSDRYGNKYAACDYTLGSLIYIVGIAKERPVNRVFLDYSSACLYSGKDDLWIKAELASVCDFVEKVRTDYRNPASHKDAIKLVTAKQCLDYVINVQMKLKEMLGKTNH